MWRERYIFTALDRLGFRGDVEEFSKQKIRIRRGDSAEWNELMILGSVTVPRVSRFRGDEFSIWSGYKFWWRFFFRNDSYSLKERSTKIFNVEFRVGKRCSEKFQRTNRNSFFECKDFRNPKPNFAEPRSSWDFGRRRALRCLELGLDFLQRK